MYKGSLRHPCNSSLSSLTLPNYEGLWSRVDGQVCVCKLPCGHPQTIWLCLGHSSQTWEERKGHLIGLLPSQLHWFNTFLSILKKLISPSLLSALNFLGSYDLLTVAWWLQVNLTYSCHLPRGPLNSLWFSGTVLMRRKPGSQSRNSWM